MNKVLALRSACVLILALAASVARAGAPRYDHVVLVIMENHGLAEVLGNAQSPYITSLGRAGAQFNNSHGIAHPSQPNYLALFSGSSQGLVDDSCPHSFSGDNLAAQLMKAGLSFGGYSEDLPAVGFVGCGTAGYARKHAPWADFSNVPSSLHRPFSAFPADFTTLPSVSFVVPNLANDMHDGSVATGDAWVHAHMDAYVQWATTHNSLLILTFDEDDRTTSSNLIPTIMVGPGVRPGTYNEWIDHYNVLATVEAIFGLPMLTSATPVRDAFSLNPQQLSRRHAVAAVRSTDR